MFGELACSEAPLWIQSPVQTVLGADIIWKIMYVRKDTCKNNYFIVHLYLTNQVIDHVYVNHVSKNFAFLKSVWRAHVKFKCQIINFNFLDTKFTAYRYKICHIVNFRPSYTIQYVNVRLFYFISRQTITSGANQYRLYYHRNTVLLPFVLTYKSL